MRQKTNRESGYSLIELMIGVSILAIIGTIGVRSTILGQKNSQQIESQFKSVDIMARVMQKIRKSISVRNMTVSPTIVGTSALTLSVPLASNSNTYYNLTFQTICRPLPPGVVIDTTGIGAGPMKTCLDSFGCGNAKVPYIQLLRDGIIVEEQLSQLAFDAEINKADSAAGYGLCFTQTGATLDITGLIVNLKIGDHVRMASLKLQSLSVPTIKRNGIDLVPQ